MRLNTALLNIIYSIKILILNLLSMIPSTLLVINLSRFLQKSPRRAIFDEVYLVVAPQLLCSEIIWMSEGALKVATSGPRRGREGKTEKDQGQMLDQLIVGSCTKWKELPILVTIGVSQLPDLPQTSEDLSEGETDWRADSPEQKAAEGREPQTIEGIH